MRLLAFDVGGTQIKYGVIEDALNITGKGIVETPDDGFESFLELIHSIYLRYENEVEGIAMSLPGPVDVKNGRCVNCGAMKYPHDSDVGRILSERCGCRVVLENDGKAAALAEHRYGSLRGCVNAAVFLIGTGIGGGLIIDNEIVRGTHDRAGEFSFINTEASSYRDYGKILGNCCSASFLLKTYKERKGLRDDIDGHEFFKRIPEDQTASQVLDEMCLNIAVQLCNMCCLLDLEKIAIGGGISRQSVVIERIREKFEEVRRDSFIGRIRFPIACEIVPCEFHNDANLIGSYITYTENK